MAVLIKNNKSDKQIKVRFISNVVESNIERK